MKTVKTKKMKNSVKDYVKGLVGSKTNEQPVTNSEPEGESVRYCGAVLVEMSANNAAGDMAKIYSHKFEHHTPAFTIAEDLIQGMFELIEDNPDYYGADANVDVEFHGIINAVANGAATFISHYRDILKFYRFSIDIVYEKHGSNYTDPVITVFMNKDDNTLGIMSIMIPTLHTMRAECLRHTSIFNRVKRSNAIDMTYSHLVSAFVYASIVEKATNGRSSIENTDNAIPAYTYFLHECRRFIDGFMGYNPSREQYVVTVSLEDGKSSVVMSEQAGSNPPSIVYTAHVDPKFYYIPTRNADVQKIVKEIAAM